MATTKSIILVVEDEKESRDSLREILEFEGYQVETAVNGQEALDALNAAAIGSASCCWICSCP